MTVTPAPLAPFERLCSVESVLNQDLLLPTGCVAGFTAVFARANALVTRGVGLSEGGQQGFEARHVGR